MLEAYRYNRVTLIINHVNIIISLADGLWRCRVEKQVNNETVCEESASMMEIMWMEMAA